MRSSNQSCDRVECDFSLDGKFCEMLDRAGIPKDAKWRTLILYMRGIKEYSYLSEMQKGQVQNLLMEVLQGGDFSDDKFRDVLQREKEIMVAPYEHRLKAALHETAALADEFKQMVQRRKGDVKHLEDRSVQAVTSGQDPEEIVSMLQATFREVLHMMEQDAAALDQLSKTDPLTGLNNRRAFDEVLSHGVREWKLHNTPLSLMMLDIDHFKNFNDEFGHRIGDQALTTVATIIRKSIAQFGDEGVDITPCRYGGEEFGIILHGGAALIADELALSVRRRMENYNFIIRDGNGDIIRKGIHITISSGIAEAMEEWRSAMTENLIDAADKALYYAKRMGRNRVAKFVPGNPDSFTIIDGS
ncbi:GGDEF domain-containing protein [Desulfovibrio psychrotolerans]|uniref:diguanylate cyclase n=1 Tax=Desulfovibrio psychrotolerans TaxID=415242 RepID=A0A7J0BPE6_9BACT|nr:GGDEF domain-containing protein [Desulfovibrio psychrotolerans]GFM35576.1 GGDEF domain-containing protein [Desulfovibrio psychrotolerans]